MRADLAVVAAMVPHGSRVLDLGCGDGDLLAALIGGRGCRGQGVEVAPEALQACIARGIPVVQADIDDGLPDFDDASFDVVVLSQTLPAVRDPVRVLREMMRVGGGALVSFPNVGHWRPRARLAVRGRVPVGPAPARGWHETRDIHPCTLRDFEDLAAAEGLRVRERRLLDREGRAAPVRAGRRPNLLAAGAAYLLGRTPR